MEHFTLNTTLTVAVPIHRKELLYYTHKNRKVCEENGYIFDVYEQYGEKNGSALVGRKELVKRCKTEYIWIIDADDWILPLDFELHNDIEMIYAKKSNGEIMTYTDNGTPIGMPPTWLRICRTEVAKRAIEHYPDIFAIDGEDTCFSYWLEQEAKTKTVHRTPYYIYNLCTSSVAGIMTVEKLLKPFKYVEVYKYLPKEYKKTRDKWLVMRICMSPYFDDIIKRMNELDLHLDSCDTSFCVGPYYKRGLIFRENYFKMRRNK